jgi:lysozyme family protein
VIGNFLECLKEVLRHEGGYVNHPADPGGMTNLGVTKRTWEAFKGREVDESTMRSLTVDDVTPLYRDRYWAAVKADSLPPGVDLAVFDIAVNSGQKRAGMILQQALGVSQDGVIGPRTIQAASIVHASGLINDICDARLAYLKSLHHWPTFGKGWGRRVEAVRKKAVEMSTRPATP